MLSLPDVEKYQSCEHTILDPMIELTQLMVSDHTMAIKYDCMVNGRLAHFVAPNWIPVGSFAEWQKKWRILAMANFYKMEEETAN